MKQIITIKFKDGKQITVEAGKYDFGLLKLGDVLSFNANNGTLYKQKGNVICGEDITNTVDTVVMTIKY